MESQEECLPPTYLRRTGAVESIRELEPEATVTEGLLTGASNAESDLDEWLGSIGLEQ